jgi:hypothetical protein
MEQHVRWEVGIRYGGSRVRRCRARSGAGKPQVTHQIRFQAERYHVVEGRWLVGVTSAGGTTRSMVKAGVYAE